MKLTTEYLVVVERATAEALYGLCNSAEDFLRLLKSDPNLEVHQGRIRFRREHEFVFHLRTKELNEKLQRFFYFRVEHDGAEAEIPAYNDLLRSVRKAVGGAGGHIETLWDDVSLHLSKKSYPLIHCSESLLRKLIAYFMLTTIGKEWIAETSPATFKEALTKSKRKQYVDVLHQVDFIQLGDFLFRAYSTRDFSEAFAALDAATTVQEVNILALRECIPRSNWDRYFSKIVACTNEHLDKSWRDLYELRCAVAHNSLMSQQDYDRIVALTTDLNGHFQKAIDNIDSIHVPDQERDVVAEQAAVNISDDWREFLTLWKSLEVEMLRISAVDGARQHGSFYELLAKLTESDVIDERTRDAIRSVRDVRNKLVHGMDEPPAEHILAESIARLRNILSTLRPTRRWKDEIVEAIRSRGGEASLTEIYAQIEDGEPRELPENWKAVVRYTLQLNCSETDVFSKRGGDDLFRHAGTGRWALRAVDA